MSKAVSVEFIREKIFFIRGKKVMLDKDLAELYQVPTKRLKEQVKRNMKRFPSDFMYQLTDKEVRILRSQIATSSWGGSRYQLWAFTEQGIAMLSSVLNSERAIRVNIAIMRTFVKIRQMFSAHKELEVKLKELQGKVNKHDEEIQAIFTVIQKLMSEPEPESEPEPQPLKKPMGFYIDK